MLETLKKLVRLLRSIPYRGSGRRCEICDATAAQFLPFGVPRREDAQCWRCHSLERHRFMWRFVTSELGGELDAGTRCLHIAPEACIASKLRELLSGGYLTADLHASGVDVQMDITDIQFPDGSFDIIICSHVLEHVENDREALGEFFRILKSDGLALLAVPIAGETTYEDASIVVPAERLKAFGQSDHVRCYGLDFIDRVEGAGFDVRRITPKGYMSANDRQVFGVTDHAGDIFVAQKA